MVFPTFVTAALLITVGVVGYLSQDPAKASGTAMIPAYFGFVLGMLGFAALVKGFRKHAMHAAAALALLGALGAPYPVLKRIAKGGDFHYSEPAVISATLTTFICLVFLGLCVNSFIQARKARRAAAVAPPAA